MPDSKTQSGGVPQHEVYKPIDISLATTRRTGIKLDSKLDVGQSYVSPGEVNESRAQRQDTADKAFNGILKGTGLAVTTFAHTFSALPVGIALFGGKMISGKGFDESMSSVYDNFISQEFDKFNKNMEEWLPNYYTQEEMDARAFSPDNWFTANFLFDKVIKNAGFTVGAIGSGSLVAKYTYGLAKLATLGRSLATEAAMVNNLVSKGMELTAAQAKVASGLRAANMAAKFTATMAAAGSEGSIEALESKNHTKMELLAKFKEEHGRMPQNDEIQEIEDLANAAGNSTFAANLAILGTSDIIQFGRFLGGGYANDLARLKKAGQKLGIKEGQFVAKELGKNAGRNSLVGGLTKGGITEAWEEGAQMFSSSTSQSFAARKYDQESIDSLDNLILSIGDGLGKTFGTKEGLESMLLGAITGIGSRTVTGEVMNDYRQPAEDNRLQQQAAAILNSKNAKGLFKEAKDRAVTGISIAKSMEKALAEGDVFEFKNLQHDYFKNYVHGRIATGKFDLLLDELADLREIAQNTTEEFEQTFGLEKAVQSDRNLATNFVNEIEAKAREMKKIEEDIETRFPQASPRAKEEMFYNLSDVKNVDKRIQSINTEISRLSLEHGIPLDLMSMNLSMPSAISDKYHELAQHFVDKNPATFDAIAPLFKDMHDLVVRKQNLFNEYRELAKDSNKYIEKKDKLAQAMAKELTQPKETKQPEVKASVEKKPSEVTSIKDLEDEVPAESTAGTVVSETDFDLEQSDENIDDMLAPTEVAEQPSTSVQQETTEDLNKQFEEESGITPTEQPFEVEEEEPLDAEFETTQEQPTAEEKLQETKPVEDIKPEIVYEGAAPLIKGETYFTEFVRPTWNPSINSEFSRVANLIFRGEATPSDIIVKISAPTAGKTKHYRSGVSVVPNEDMQLNLHIRGKKQFSYIPSPHRIQRNGETLVFENYSNDELRRLINFRSDMTDAEIDALKAGQQRAIKFWDDVTALRNAGVTEFALSQLNTKLDVTSSFDNADYTDRPLLTDISHFNHDGKFYIYDGIKDTYMNPLDPSLGETDVYDVAPAPEDYADAVKHGIFGGRYFALMNKPGGAKWQSIKPRSLTQEELGQMVGTINDLVVRINNAPINEIEPLQAEVQSRLNEKYFIKAQDNIYLKYRVAQTKDKLVLQIVAMEISKDETEKIVDEVMYVNKTLTKGYSEIVNLVNAKAKSAKFKLVDQPFAVHVPLVNLSTPSAELAKSFEATADITNLQIKFSVDTEQLVREAAQTEISTQDTAKPVIELPVETKLEGKYVNMSEEDLIAAIKDKKTGKQAFLDATDEFTLLMANTNVSEEDKKPLLDMWSRVRKARKRTKIGGVANKLINLSEARSWIKRNLPEGISVESVDRITDELEVNGVLWGAYANKVIYLNSAAESGTEYHEAFHAVFRGLLNNKQIERYHDLARSKFGTPSIEEIDNLIRLNPNLEDLDDSELADLVIEEKMADEFMEYMNNRPVSRFARLFERIKNFVLWVVGSRSKLENLYDTIERGGYKNSKFKTNIFERANIATSISASQILGELDLNQSKQLVGDIVSKLATKGGLTKDNAESEIEAELDLRKRMYSPKNPGNAELMKTKDLRTALAFKYEVFEDEDLRDRVKELVLAQLTPALELEELEYEDYLDAINDLGEGGWDKSFWEQGGFENVSKEIKYFIKTTSYRDTDDLGQDIYTIIDEDKTELVPVDRQISYPYVFSALQMNLANTDLINMPKKIKTLAENDKQLEAVWGRLKAKTGIREREDGTYAFDVTNGELFANQFFKTFENVRLRYDHTDVNAQDGEYAVYNANQREPKKDILKDWALNYESIYSKGTRDWKVVGNALGGIYNKYIRGGYTNTKENVDYIVGTFAEAGITLPRAFVIDSLEQYKFNVDNPNILNPETINVLSSMFTGKSVIDPFSGVIRGDEGRGMTGRLLELAEATVAYRDDVIVKSFQDAAGKTRYSYVKSNEFIDRVGWVNTLKNEGRRAKLVDEYLVDEQGNTRKDTDGNPIKNPNFKPFFKNNYLLISSNATEILSKIHVSLTGDIREKSAKGGVTLKDIDPKAFQVMQHTLFFRNDSLNKKVGLTENKLTYAKYIPMVMEAKNTIFNVALPVNYTGYYNKGVTPEALKVLYNNLFITEFNRIKATQRFLEENKDDAALIRSYHKAKGLPRGTTFTDLTFLEREFVIGGETIHIGNMVRDMKTELPSEKQVGQIREAMKQAIEAEVNAEIASAIKNDLISGEFLGDGTPVITGTKSDSPLVSKGIASVLGIAPNEVSTDKLRNYFGSFMVNNIISNISINQLVVGDTAVFKDDVDVVKRAGGIIAAGNSLYSPFTSKPHPNAKIEGRALANHEFLAATIKDPKAYVLRETSEAFYDGDSTLEADRKALTEKEFEAKYADIDIADAQSYVLLSKKIQDEQALGRLTPKALANLKRIEEGDPTYVWQSEEIDGFVLNSDKNVYYDSNAVYKKDSEIVLTKKLTSMLVNGEWVARPGREYLHQMREWMESKGIEKVNTLSGSKGRASHVLDAKPWDKEVSNDALISMINDRRAQRKQVETPSGKTEIVYGTQLIQLIDAELDDSVALEFEGSITTMGDLRRLYRDLLSTTRTNDYETALKELGRISGGSLERADDAVFERMQENLRATGVSENIVEFFAPGNNPNLPHTLAKFEQMFLAHFKSAYRQKTAGLKMSLVSPLGFNVNVMGDQVITQADIEKDLRLPDARRNYFNPDGSPRFESRPPKAQRKSVDGKEILYAEMQLPLWAKDLYGIEETDSEKMDPETRDKILTMMGIRIPTQSYHSMVHFKVVDFLPAEYGSVIVVPAEIAYLAGSDFDIDSMFVYRKEYRQDTEGNFKVYENGTPESMFADYKDYMLNSREVKNKVRELIYESREYAGAPFKKKNEIRAKIENQALVELGYASTLEEYIAMPESKKAINPLVNNRLLDAKLAILSNPSIWDAYKTPASLDAMKNSEDKIFVKKREQSESSNLRVSPTGIRSAWNNNAVGKKNVGPWANANVVSASLTRHKVSLDDTMPTFNIPIVDGLMFSSFEYQEELDVVIGDDLELVKYNGEEITGTKFFLGQEFQIVKKDGQTYYKRENSDILLVKARKADSLSTGVSAMTDNAKERLAAKLNITLRTSSTAASMLSLGMGTMRSMLLLNQEVIREVSEKAAQLDSAVNVIDPSVKQERQVEGPIAASIEEKLKGIGQSIQADDADRQQLYNSMNEGVEDKIPFEATDLKQYDDMELTSEMMLRALDLEKGLANRSALEQYEYHAIQLAAINFYINQKKVADDMSNLSTLMKLNKGLPTTLEEMEGIYQAAVDMGISGFEGNYTYHNPVFSLSNVVAEDANLRKNLESFKEVMDTVAKSYFIGQTNLALDIKNELLNTELSNFSPDVVKNSINGELIAYLAVRVYERVFNKNNPDDKIRLAEYEHLIHPHAGETLALRLEKLRVDYPEFAANEFIRFLDTEISNTTAKRTARVAPKNAPSVDVIVGDTRTKLPEEYINDLVDSFKELSHEFKYSEEVNDFAKDMFLYLVIKDNLQFKNRSFINYISVGMYADVMEGLNMVTAELSKPSITARFSDTTQEGNDLYLNDRMIHELTGFTSPHLKDDFIRRFMKSNSIGSGKKAKRFYKNARQFSYKDIKGKEGKASLDVRFIQNPKGGPALGVRFSLTDLQYDENGQDNFEQLGVFKPYYSRGKKDLLGMKLPKFINYRAGKSSTGYISYELVNIEELENVLSTRNEHRNSNVLKYNGATVGFDAIYVPVLNLGDADWKIYHYATIADALDATNRNRGRGGDQHGDTTTPDSPVTPDMGPQGATDFDIVDEDTLDDSLPGSEGKDGVSFDPVDKDETFNYIAGKLAWAITDGQLTTIEIVQFIDKHQGLTKEQILNELIFEKNLCK